MTPTEYVRQALRSESNYNDIANNLLTPQTANPDATKCRLLHGALGLVTEAGEIADVMKKKLAYNKPIDGINLLEELGDVMWYVAIMVDALDTSIEEVMELNIKKLQKRYPKKFTSEAAIDRNLIAERQVLEGAFDTDEEYHDEADDDNDTDEE